MSDTYEVRRSTTIAAPAHTIFELVNNLKSWESWSPWEGLDDALNREYSGPAEGVGAAYAWSGNRKAGQGTMKISKSEPTNLVGLDLAFLKPFKSQSTVRFDIDANGDATNVAWVMNGKKNLFMKILGPLMSMDKMVGKDFEKGLAQLKAVAETKA